MTGPQGPNGTNGTNGTNGSNGTNGLNATMSVGTVSTGAPASSVIVTNTGTSTSAIWNFTIPRGDTGSAATAQDFAVMGMMSVYNNFGLNNTIFSNTAGIQVSRKITGQQIGDLIRAPFNLIAGTYTLGVFGAKVANSGIWEFNVDGVGVTYTIDMYSAATTAVILYPGTFTVTSGKHYLYVKCVGTSAGGTNYYGYFGGFNLLV